MPSGSRALRYRKHRARIDRVRRIFFAQISRCSARGCVGSGLS